WRGPALAVPGPRHSWGERGRALLGVWPLLAIFIVVFGGIYGGLFSPTEGASIGALATLASGLFSGELRGEGLKRALLGTAETTAMVFMIFLGADMMNSALALTQMPAHLAQWVGGLPVAPLLIVAGVLAFYVVLGCVMDELSMLLLTIPVIFPTIMGLDLWGLAAEPKAIWFGILVLMTVGIGMLAPPVGLNVYVVNGMAREVPMNETYKGVVPFLVSDVLRLLLLLFVPAVSVGVLRWL
ncbi:MAG: TRAP transporter large permease subunit, partial [Rubrivivax sp.]